MHNVYDDVIYWWEPPTNLNSANIFYPPFGSKSLNLKTANISSYMVYQIIYYSRAMSIRKIRYMLYLSNFYNSLQNSVSGPTNNSIQSVISTTYLCVRNFLSLHLIQCDSLILQTRSYYSILTTLHHHPQRVATRSEALNEINTALK